MNKTLVALLASLLSLVASAQENLPTDYLTKEFHRGRRDAFREMMPANSIAFVFSYPERVFSNDVSYVFHQNPDLYYLTGYKEPDAVLVLFKENQGNADSAYNELFFVRQRNALQETWTGRRLGVDGVKQKLGFQKVYNGQDFASFPIDVSKFKVVITDVLPSGMSNEKSGSNLETLVDVLRNKLGSQPADTALHQLFQYAAHNLTMGNISNFKRYVERRKEEMPSLSSNPVVQLLINNPTAEQLDSVKTELLKDKWGIDYFNDITKSLRQIKTAEEMVLMRKVAMISAVAHAEVMKAVEPTMSEREAEGIQLYVHKRYGSEDEGYPAIVGAGANSCILHYEENSSLKLNNQLLLMDVGAEYHGYSADVTRTIPAKGKFSPEQRAIYQIVYDAQEAVFQLCKEGTPISDLNKKAKEIIAEGLLKLGIIKTKDEVDTYYPHGCSHFLGLDVHDKGDYGTTLKQNMVLTVEPGIYIPENSKCDKKWWNIGVRIEDDILVKKDSFENLSAYAPRKIEDIEKMSALKSGFNSIELPALNVGKAGF
ncbi:MAG TPA: aminopeptidase P N-terminal domain-containing protein [Flavitalea sp.]|nr:aminopeptidase P N-terminal domain-containing protein [Flavitalea sp.]